MQFDIKNLVLHKMQERHLGYILVSMLGGKKVVENYWLLYHAIYQDEKLFDVPYICNVSGCVDTLSNTLAGTIDWPYELNHDEQKALTCRISQLVNVPINFRDVEDIYRLLQEHKPTARIFNPNDFVFDVTTLDNERFISGLSFDELQKTTYLTTTVRKKDDPVS